MTTSEKFLHIITVGFWSPYIPDEAKLEFEKFVTKIIEETNRRANDEIDEQTAGDMDEKLNVVTAKFYDLDVEYSIIMDKFFLKHANSQRSELICSPAVQDKLNKEIAPVRIKYALNKFINLRNLRDQYSSGRRSVRLAVKRADDNSQTVKVDFIEYVEHERRMETKEIICSIPEGKIINLSDTHLEKVGLNKADLKNVCLKNACLKNAFFLETHLEGADLEGANMEGAELMFSYFDDSSSLIGANLTRANLSGASLTGTNLTGTKLSGANLTGTKLSGANLTDVDLTDVDLTRADLNGANLKGVKNWDKANWESVRNWKMAHLPEGLRKHLEHLEERAAILGHRF